MSEAAPEPLPEKTAVEPVAADKLRFRLDRTIKLGECLTVITVVLSAAALYLSLAKDRELRIHEQASRVREAAGVTLAKVDRLQVLSLSIFDDLQPLFVEVSQEFARTKSAVAARDLFWKGTNEVRLTHQHRIRDEQIETGYVVLVGFDPEVRAVFRKALQQRSDFEDRVFAALLIQGEQDIFAFEKAKTFTPAQMGNALRETAASLRGDYESQVTTVVKPLQSLLLSVLTRADGEIVERRRSGEGH